MEGYAESLSQKGIRIQRKEIEEYQSGYLRSKGLLKIKVIDLANV